MSETYEPPYLSDVRRNLRFAIDEYHDLLELNHPLSVLQKIEKENAEYIQLKKDLADLPLFTAIKKYIDRYDKDRISLGSIVEMYGNNIDKGYGKNICESGNTIEEEYNIAKTAYRMHNQDKQVFRKKYKYLTTQGQTDLKVFETREISNRALKEKAINACIDANPEKQKKLLDKKISDFRHSKPGMPSRIQFLASYLQKHFAFMTTNNLDDEFTTTYLQDGEKTKILNDYDYLKSITTANPRRIEHYVFNITTGKLAVKNITPKISTFESEFLQ